MNIILLEYPACTTCKKAKKWLLENDIVFISRDITVETPTLDELKRWTQRTPHPITKFFNTSGIIYRENNYKDKIKTMSGEDMLKDLSENGMLIKRPLLISEEFVLIGFKEDEWRNILL